MIILIGIGGSLGAVTRWIIGKWMTNHTNTKFPIGTFFINVTGSFLLGFFFQLHASHIISETSWTMFAIGFLGSYTTFSTFSYEALSLFVAKKKQLCILYIISSTCISILFAWLGITLSKIFL